MNLKSDELLDQIEAENPKLGIFLRQSVLASINNVAKQAGVSPVGKLTRPDPPQGISVKVVGEHLHVAIQDNNVVHKPVRYFVHIDTTPQFSQPIVHDYGASRTVSPHFLPAKNDAGVAQTYYVRAFKQYHGSDPSAPIVYGGQNPIGITMTGSTNFSLLPSTGSGTGNNNGQSGPVGMGFVQTRPAPQPKRNVSK